MICGNTSASSVISLLTGSVSTNHGAMLEDMACLSGGIYIIGDDMFLMFIAIPPPADDSDEWPYATLRCITKSFCSSQVDGLIGM